MWVNYIFPVLLQLMTKRDCGSMSNCNKCISYPMCLLACIYGIFDHVNERQSLTAQVIMPAYILMTLSKSKEGPLFYSSSLKFLQSIFYYV